MSTVSTQDTVPTPFNEMVDDLGDAPWLTLVHAAVLNQSYPTGRLHRSHPGKSEVRIYGYVDGRAPVLARMSQRRLVGYRSIGYKAA